MLNYMLPHFFKFKCTIVQLKNSYSILNTLQGISIINSNKMYKKVTQHNFSINNKKENLPIKLGLKK